MPPDQLFENCNSLWYHWVLKLLVTTWKSEFWEQNCLWLFYYFNFERNYDVLKSKSSCIYWTKTLTSIKAKQNPKLKIPHTVLERRTFCFISYENHKIKVKLWWVGACESNFWLTGFFSSYPNRWNNNFP